MKTIEWQYRGCACELVQRHLRGTGDYWCGYATIPHQLTREEIEEVDVHGGVTYYAGSPDGSAECGFDCAHLGDVGRPTCQSEEWLRGQCEQMVDSVLEIAG